MEPLSRRTPATAAVLATLLSSKDAQWGLQIVKQTGLKTGTVYPILERLEAAGWVEAEWDTDDTRKGPRRRYFRLAGDAVTRASQYVASLEDQMKPKRSVALGFDWITP